MSDIEEISQLVLWERQARGRGLDDELANCYWEDGTVTTSWSKGNARETFIGQRPVDYATDLPLVGRYAAPIVHLNGNRAYAELLPRRSTGLIWTATLPLLNRSCD
ncbi:hypothetical protein [Secundilactobacillus silagei]|uniref:hypothetical protein n=1 Tax=Secundilactobacillus silagei TaxID=1293415 RepID=UPI0006D18404|nr:hypothetical protein [Secundilactobacillus silagei]